MHVLQRTRHLRHPLAHLARAKAWRDLNTTAVAAAAAATAAAAGRMPQDAVTAAGVAATNVAALGLLSYGGGERAAAGVLEDDAERSLVLVGGEVRDDVRVGECAQ